VKSEVQRIIDTLKHAYEKNAWHGPSVKEAIEDVTTENAFLRLPDSHSIIELVAHMAAWRRYVAEKLAGNEKFELTEEQNFPKPANWEKTVSLLDESQRQLIAQLEKTPDERLQEIVPGRKFKFYVMLHGIIHHDLYHTGQIILLKKLK